MSHLKFFVGTSKWWKLLFAVMIVSAWLYVWYFPWPEKLHHIFWLQLGAGLAIFVIPGFCVYGLLCDNPNLEFNHVTFGFVISHLIFALLGTVGRFIHLSFESIRFLMMALGLLLLCMYILSKFDCGFKFQMNRERSAYILSTIPILWVALLVGLIVIQRALSDDDLTYLAYLTNWQHAIHLDFNDLVFGKSQLVSPRFWLMSAPFAQAFLAGISQVPGILILGGYYEPFLVILSVLCWYELALSLKLSPRSASASVILQLSFLLLLSEYLHPGAAYFDQLSADKATATFLFAPVFFQSLMKLLEDPTWNNRFLFLLAGLSLTLIHPIILAYSVFMGGLLILLSQSGQGFRNKVMPVIILIVIMLPQVAIRFAKVPALAPISFDPEVILNQSGSDNLTARWGDTRYYGFNPNILTMSVPYEENIPLPEPVIRWGWMLVPISAAALALRQRDTGVAQFIIAGFVLCFLAGFPFTGWIMGYFLNARMLARSVWLFPFGISAVYLLGIVVNKFRNKADAKSARFLLSAWPLFTITLFSTVLFLLFLREHNLPDFEKFSLKSIRYQGFSTAGETLDHWISNDPVVLGSPSLNDLLPGISWKSQLVTFRIQNPGNMAYFTTQEREARIADTQTIFSPLISAQAKMMLLRKYNIHFLVLQRSDLKLFNDLLANYPNLTATEIGGVYIIQID